MYFRLLQCLRLVKDGVVCTGWMGWFCWDCIFTPHVLFSVLFSWYLVSGMHYGWTVDWKNIVPWHRPYPLEIISFLKWKLDLHFHIIDKKISSGFSYGLLFVFKLMASFTHSTRRWVLDFAAHLFLFIVCCHHWIYILFVSGSYFPLSLFKFISWVCN